ncbi:unnamed protein product [Rotaria socialis]|uniref:Uncharacterized protein n=1 Tax=Rotaria socialis TaxID=392032 RepID=A0A820F5K7_9BILA|nr:unnamed protein product [Rotaria socialis]CAF4256511.1 unnamed protein product [Rotaria socialis]
MSSLEFPDLVYPEYLICNDQPHEILLDQWPTTTMDLAVDKNFVMQKISSSQYASTLRAAAPPFAYSIATEDLTHMNKYTLSTKYKNNSNRLIAKHNHLIYVTKKNQLNIQSLLNNTYDDLWSNTVEHLSHGEQRRHTIQSSTSIKLLDCTVEDEQILNIALADQKGLSFYSYSPTTETSTLASHIETPEHTSILSLSFNPYIPSNAILIDKNHRTYLLDDGIFTYLHQQTDEKTFLSDTPRQVYLDWDASPFLYTIADSHQGSCLLFDIRLRNESFKEIFTIGNHHPYLAKTEIIRGYKTSAVNPYQHVFITDYSLIIIDSRMANRPAIHSHHELLRPPTAFTQMRCNDQHIIFINDEFNTNVLEYNTDTHRRLIQVCPSWELCPMSNSRIYLINNNNHTNEELLFAKSIYFDIPIRDMAAVPNPNNTKSFLLFQLNSTGNIHVQPFNESIDKNEEKTWNPDPDGLLKQPPDCFRNANDYWSKKFSLLFQCPACLTYNSEPTNFTIVTPLIAMTKTSLRDFSTFQNEHKSTEKVIPAELFDCPTCACLPMLDTPGQLSRAQNWIQDWKSKLDDIQQESIDTPQSTTYNWRKIFDYDELNETNKDSELWNEIHRPWWPAQNSTEDDLVKQSLQ